MLAGFVILAGLIIAEVAGRIAYRLGSGQWYSVGVFEGQLQTSSNEVDAAAPADRTGGPDSSGSSWPEIIHPYLGFVQRAEGNKTRIDSYGFPLNTGDPIRDRSEPECVIGIFGGSFAQGVATHHDRLVAAVTESGKRPVIINTAMGGYKQPQQLLALCYLLSLGAHFDVVVNIDGFNEIALPPVENIPKGVFPFYPRNWYFRSLTIPGENVQIMLGEIQYLRRLRLNWSVTMNRGVLKRSICWFAVWRFRERQLSERINDLQLAMLVLEGDRGTDTSVTGPPFQRGDASILGEALAGHWANCSRLMDAICRANGIRYYHYLQPNQYVPGTRNLTPRESKMAFDADHPYRRGVLDGYPHLIRLGHELAESGMAFEDLTMVYFDVQNPVYQDTCCHPDPAGYEIIGAIVGEKIRMDFSRSEQNIVSPSDSSRILIPVGDQGKLRAVLKRLEPDGTSVEKPSRLLPPINKKLSGI